MLSETKQFSKKVSSKFIDEFRFLRSWVENPMKIGAVSPSSRALANLMARQAEPERDGPIIELGPGTGVVTQALVDRGILPRRLVLVEYSPEFCRLLKKRFPAATVIRGDAYTLPETLAEFQAEKLASIVSSLPLLTRPAPIREKLLIEGLGMLAPSAPFIQFSYGLTPPVSEKAGDFKMDKSNWVVMNLPPARVWTYRRTA